MQGLYLRPQFHKKVHHVMGLLLDHHPIFSCEGGLINSQKLEVRRVWRSAWMMTTMLGPCGNPSTIDGSPCRLSICALLMIRPLQNQRVV